MWQIQFKVGQSSGELASVDQGNNSPSCDGIFFDAASAWTRDVAKRTGAANPSLPHLQPKQAVLDIQIELLKNTTAISNRFGKVAMFNMHDGDMNIQNGLEQEIMNGVGGGADTLMYRFYEQATMLTRDWIENALAERTIHLHTLVVLGAGNLVGPALQRFSAKLPAEIAVFNLIRGITTWVRTRTTSTMSHDEYNLDRAPTGRTCACESERRRRSVLAQLHGVRRMGQFYQRYEYHRAQIGRRGD